MLFVANLALSAATLTDVLPTVNETSPTVGGTITLPQFNVPGTLTAVTLNFGAGSISADTSITDIEPGGGPIDITYNLGYEVTFNLPVGGPYVAEDFQGLNCSGAGVEISSCTNSQDISFTPLNGSFDLSADISAFLSGTVPVTYTPGLVEQLSGTPQPADPANLVLSVTPVDLTMPVSITFTYTPPASVPEPDELIGIGLGLLGLGWFGRRKTVQS